MSQGGPLGAADVGPEVPTQFICDVGIAVPASNSLNIFGSSGITTTGLGDTVTISFSGSGFAWNVVTSALNPVTLIAGNAYICKGTNPVQFILPASAAVGDCFKIVGYSNLWSIAQNAMQSITIGTVTSTAGIFGGLTATTVSDGIELVCVTTNLEFYEIEIQGNILIS